MSLHSLRQGLLEGAPEDVTAYDHVPARLTVPAVIVQPGLPYLEPGDTFASFQVRHVVSLVAAVGANDVVTEAMDALIEDVLATLLNAGHAVEQVSPGYPFESNNGSYLAVDINTTTIHRIT